MTSRKPPLGRTARPATLHTPGPLTAKEREIAVADLNHTLGNLDLSAREAEENLRDARRCIEGLKVHIETTRDLARLLITSPPTIAPSRPNHAQAWLLERVLHGIPAPFMLIRGEAAVAGISSGDFDRAYNALREERLIGYEDGRLAPIRPDADARATAIRPDAILDHECRACGFVWTTAGEDLTGCAQCLGDDVSSVPAESDADRDEDLRSLAFSMAVRDTMGVDLPDSDAVANAMAALDAAIVGDGAYRYEVPPAPLDVLGRMSVGRSHGPATDCGDEASPAVRAMDVFEPKDEARTNIDVWAGPIRAIIDAG